MSKLYVRPMPADWFMRRPAYRRFMVRELTAVPIAVYLGILIVLLRRFAEGREAYAVMIESLRSPVMMAIHAAALLAALYHSITWFNLLPKGMPLRVGEDKVPGPLISIGMGYLPWGVVTAFVLWFVLGGS